MAKRASTLSKAAIAARATVHSGDIFADRTVWQFSSETQQLPVGDQRHRVNWSAKFYVVQLIGSWVNVSESAERVIHRSHGVNRVQFEGRKHELRKADTFHGFIQRFIDLGCYAHIGGMHIETVKKLRKILAQPYIYIASEAATKVLAEQRQNKRR